MNEDAYDKIANQEYLTGKQLMTLSLIIIIVILMIYQNKQLLFMLIIEKMMVEQLQPLIM